MFTFDNHIVVRVIADELMHLCKWRQLPNERSDLGARLDSCLRQSLNIDWPFTGQRLQRPYKYQGCIFASNLSPTTPTEMAKKECKFR